MSEITSELLEVTVDTDATVEIDSTLPEAQVDITKSITAEIQPENYVLTSGGIYTGSLTGAIPTWILDAINQELTTGDGNLSSVLDGIQELLDGLQLGVNQNISQIENTNLSLSALETSLSSQIGANSADILDVYATRVTETEAQAVAVQAIGATFNGNVDAYIGNLASVYTDANSAVATDISTLQASYNGQTARLDTVEYVRTGLFPEWDGLSAPQIGEYKEEANGVFYTYVGGTLGEFNDGWMRSQSSPYSYTDDIVYSLAESTGITLEDLKNQIDGVIESWYYSYMPDQTKEPWSTWIATDTTNGNTNEQIAHSGDLFYDLTTGTAYRFALLGSVYGWVEITDTAITLALKNASTAQYTADGKAAIYYSETVPVAKVVNGTTIPIETGDLWVKISTGITKVAVVDNASDIDDWGNITNTDADNALLGIAGLEETNDGVVNTFFQADAPTSGMSYGDWWVETDVVPVKPYRYEDGDGKSVGTVLVPVAWVYKDPATNIIANAMVTSESARVNIAKVVAGGLAINITDATVDTIDGNKSLLTYLGEEVDSKINIYSGETAPVDGQPLSASENDIYLWFTTSTASTEGSVYDVTRTYKYGTNAWTEITTNDELTKIADLADGKRTVYSGDTVPSATDNNLQANDLFIPSTTFTSGKEYVKNEMYRYTSSGTWDKATRYDDIVSSLEDQLDGKIQTHYGTIPFTDVTEQTSIRSSLCQ